LPATALEVAPGRQIVAYLWDPTIFPIDENGHGTAHTADDPGIPAYDRPSGRVVGRIGPACTGPGCANHCTEPECETFATVLKRPGRPDVVVPTDEWTYEIKGLVTFDPVRFVGKRAWGQVRPVGGTDADAVWVSVKSADVHLHVNRVTTIATPDTWCTAPGRCRGFTAAETKAFKAAEAAREGECAFVYSVRGVRTAGSRQYYAVEHRKGEGNPDVPPLPAVLPTKGYVPVLKRSGAHIGYFYSRGC
jgi:hypothetical protein